MQHREEVTAQELYATGKRAFDGLRTLRAAAAVPLRDVLDPYARLDLAASRSCALAWLAVLYPCRRDRLDPPEALIADRLVQARDLLPSQHWARFQSKFQRELIK